MNYTIGTMIYDNYVFNIPLLSMPVIGNKWTKPGKTYTGNINTGLKLASIAAVIYAGTRMLTTNISAKQEPLLKPIVWVAPNLVTGDISPHFN